MLVTAHKQSRNERVLSKHSESKMRKTYTLPSMDAYDQPIIHNLFAVTIFDKAEQLWNSSLCNFV